MVCYASGQEIGRTVRHVDQVGRVDGTSKRRDTRPRKGNSFDVIRRDLARPGRIGGCLSERMGGMAAGDQLDGHVGGDVPGVSQAAGHARAVGVTVDGKKSPLRLEDTLFGDISHLCGECSLYAQHCS